MLIIRPRGAIKTAFLWSSQACMNVKPCRCAAISISQHPRWENFEGLNPDGTEDGGSPAAAAIASYSAGSYTIQLTSTKVHPASRTGDKNRFFFNILNICDDSSFRPRARSWWRFRSDSWKISLILLLPFYPYLVSLSTKAGLQTRVFSSNLVARYTLSCGWAVG